MLSRFSLFKNKKNNKKKKHVKRIHLNQSILIKSAEEKTNHIGSSASSEHYCALNGQSLKFKCE